MRFSPSLKTSISLIAKIGSDKNITQKAMILKKIVVILASIRSIQVDFSDYYASGRADDNILMIICKPISGLHKLLKLNLNLKKNREITDDGILIISITVSRLINLNSLYLNCEGQITHYGIDHLANSISNIKHLYHLGLNIGWTRLTNIDIMNMTKKVLSKSTYVYITTLKLDFSHVKEFGNNELGILGQMLSKLKGISTLCLNFSENEEITDTGIMKLLQPLIKCKYLATVDLNFSYLNFMHGNITDISLARIATVLAKLTGLSTLKLNFGRNNQISDQGLIKIAQVIGRQKLLTSLSLNFKCDSFGNGNITDSSLLELARSISNLALINSLNLTIESKFISDNGLNEIAKVLGGLKLLNSLYLNFESDIFGSGKLTDNCLKELAEMIKIAPALSILHLNFKRNEMIKDHGVKKILRAIKKRSSLSCYYLNFNWCNLTDKVKELLEKAKGVNLSLKY